MKKYFTVLIVVFQITTSNAQKGNQIRYILPDKIEIALDSCIKKYNLSGVQYYFLLRKDSIYSVTIGRYRAQEKKNISKWISKSNRFVVVNKMIYPLIFDYDSKFAAVDNDNIAEFGKRDDKIKRATIILHGATIYFDSNGNILRIEDW